MPRPLIPALLLLVGCAHQPELVGAAPAHEAELAPARAEPAPEPEASPAVAKGDATISARALAATVARGLGVFLGGVETDPVFAGGRFAGWRVGQIANDALRPWLERGDIVQRVNGLGLERPDDAMRVWDGLGRARELTIELTRRGQPRVLRWIIVEDKATMPAEGR